MILVLGGSGLLGSAILKHLQRQRYPARVLTRGMGDWRSSNIPNLKQQGTEVVVGDMTDPNVLTKAISGCTAVIHAGGSFFQSNADTMKAVHLDVVENLTRISELGGVQRFIHVSCLGASEHSASKMMQYKWEAEQIVKDAPFYWTIVRPSYFYGSSFPFMNILLPVLKMKPVIPVPGAGLSEIEPVFVDDVANVIVQSLYNRGTVSKVYEVGGPITYTILEFIELIKEYMKIKTPLMHIPTDSADKSAKVFGKIVKNVHTDLIGLLSVDSTCKQDGQELPAELSGMTLEEHLGSIIQKL
ncbi:MAG TPA: NmrA family NAD(P)-binding protein [Candidatus Obscuribacter sp.]|nr:NmrA family NAD(P)-binding protein [Candidatus Melainabacteria bacterium]HNH76674.1 NmrA family NAD(P)-binding protein [Candidatus Obscuribacter sp.]